MAKPDEGAVPRATEAREMIMIAALLFALHTTFAHAGRVTIDARLAHANARVVVRDAAHRVLYDATLPVPEDDPERQVHTAAFHVDGLSSPVVLVVVDGPAADGVWIVPLILGESRDGRVVQLFDPGIDRFEDGICIEPWGIVAGTEHIGMLAVMEKHPYDIRRWVVRDGKLVRESHVRTHGRYLQFSDAIAELGLHCTNRIEQLASH